jgi:hypothetical protein
MHDKHKYRHQSTSFSALDTCVFVHVELRLQLSTCEHIVYVFVKVCVLRYVCMYVCLYVCDSVCICLFIHVCIYVYT